MSVSETSPVGGRFASLVRDQSFKIIPEFILECGVTLREVPVAYKTWGELNATRDNVMEHLKHLAATNGAAVYLATSAEADESSSSGEEILWSDEELDQQAQDTYQKLFQSVNALPSKRPWHYSGNSKRTKQRRRTEGKRQAEKNGQTILNFFSPISVSTSNVTLDEGCGSDDSVKRYKRHRVIPQSILNQL